MSAADDAYEVAENIIAAAIADGSDVLRFDYRETRALNRLPPEIGDVSNLWLLDM